MKDRLRRIKELIRHKLAFWKVERTTFKRFTFRRITHDLDKLILYFLSIKTSYIRSRHKLQAKYHNPKNLIDYYERLVDVECARYTKRNSTWTAREYIINSYDFKSAEYSAMMYLADLYNLK